MIWHQFCFQKKYNFVDVTLAGKDKHIFQAHKVMLWAVGSLFSAHGTFKKIYNFVDVTLSDKD